MSQIYSIIPAAQRLALNAFFVAYGWGQGTYDQPLTTDDPATTSSPATHYHNYNASAQPGDFSLFSLAKAGTLPVNDMNGNPIPYGEEGVVSEADAIAGFAALQLWANDSDEPTGPFAEGRRSALGLSLIPSGIEF